MTDDDRSTRRGAVYAALALVLLVVVAFALRVRGLDSSLPHAPELHERVFFAQVSLLESGAEHPERELDFGFYPQFVARLCTWFPATQPAEPHTLGEHLAAAAVPRLHIRWVSMLLSLVILPATYLVARRFVARGTALLAVIWYLWARVRAYRAVSGAGTASTFTIARWRIATDPMKARTPRSAPN